MKRRTRINYSASQRTMMWDLYKRGESLHTIASLFDRYHGSVAGIIGRSGGIRPAERKRRDIYLSAEEREEISRAIATGTSIRSIARALNRSPSTISREIARNGGLKKYRAHKADEQAWENAKRPKECKLSLSPMLKLIVARKLKQSWSPQQIAGWLNYTYPEDQGRTVSHETIYKTLYIQSRGALKKELVQHLRSNRIMRRSRHSSLKNQGLGKIVDGVSISERPASVEDRAVPGHWEGDLIQGSGKTFIATLVERHTRYVMLAKVKNNDTATVVDALIKQSRKLPKELYKSLTWDRGAEMKGHKEFTIATDIKVFFCDPQSPWQRGSNENTNRLLRQYFPKGTDISIHSQAHLNKVARQLNERPRKTLNYRAPADKFNECVALTG